MDAKIEVVQNAVQQLVALEDSQHEKFKKMDAKIEIVQNAVQSIDDKMESFQTENESKSQEDKKAEAVIVEECK